jgi:site-specific recombinase XerD
MSENATYLEHPQFKDFVAYLRLKNVSKRTIEEYTKVLRALFSHVHLGDAPPATITAEQLRSYFTILRQQGLAPKTLADRVMVVKSFFGFLLQEDYLTTNPSRGIPLPQVGQRLPKVLSMLELQQLFAAFDDTAPPVCRDKIFFKIAYAGGLRISEVTHLRVDDIDWGEGWLRVIGKGDKERRVYLKPAVLQTLREYVHQFQIKHLLFPGRKGQPVTMRNMDMRFEVYVQKAGLPKWVTPHSLRHSIAVHYLMGGAPLSFVQELLGHAKLSTTGIYTRLTDPMMKEIVLRIPTALDTPDNMPRQA